MLPVQLPTLLKLKNKNKMNKETFIKVIIKTFKILNRILKALFKGACWLWKHRKHTKKVVVYGFCFGLISYWLFIFAHAKPFAEACENSKGMFTIAEDGFVAKNLVQRCKDSQVVFPHGYNSPKDLFYTFLKEDGTYVSQSLKEHFNNNGYLAIDIATGGKSINVYAPSYMYLSEKGEEMDTETEYVASRIINEDTTGLTLVLRMVGTNKAFMIGHMAEITVKEGQTVRTGDIVGRSGGCPDSLQYGERSTGCHIHLEFRVENRPTPYPEYMYSNHNADLERYRVYKESKPESLDELNDIYFKFGNHYKMLPFILSAMHQQESGRCIENCTVSRVGARGAMQFMNNTWGEYGCDGNMDGQIDVENLEDAMCGASNYMTYLFEEKGRGQNPDINWQWQWWKAIYIYNAGYGSEPTHAHGIPSAVNYADNIMNMALELSAKK